MTLYSSSYYEGHQAGSRSSAKAVVPVAMQWVSPRSVVDVGYGVGAWLTIFAEYGVDHIRGIDGPWVDPNLLHIPRDC